MTAWTATIRGLTIGSSSYPITEPGISGLGVPEIRAVDQPRGHLSGDVGGDDVLSKRVITIPTGCNAADAAAAWTLLTALKTAWAPSYVDIPLVLSFAGVSLTYNGRPRGLEADLADLSRGWVAVLLTFEALNPFAEGEPVDSPVGS